MFCPMPLLAIDNEGDRRFMHQLFEDEGGLMIGIAMRMLGDRSDAEDVVQEVFLSFCKHLTLLHSLSICSLRGYIVVSIRNACNDALRKRSQRDAHAVYDAQVVIEDMPSDEDCLDDQVIAKANMQELMAAIGQLPEREQYVINAKFLLEKPNQEIAEALGIKPDSVRQYLTNARRRLRRILEGGAYHER